VAAGRRARAERGPDPGWPVEPPAGPGPAAGRPSCQRPRALNSDARPAVPCRSTDAPRKPPAMTGPISGPISGPITDRAIRNWPRLG